MPRVHPRRQAHVRPVKPERDDVGLEPPLQERPGQAVELLDVLAVRVVGQVKAVGHEAVKAGEGQELAGGEGRVPDQLVEPDEAMTEPARELQAHARPPDVGCAGRTGGGRK